MRPNFVFHPSSLSMRCPQAGQMDGRTDGCHKGVLGVLCNDGDLIENGNPNDEVECNDYAFQILLDMRAYGEV